MRTPRKPQPGRARRASSRAWFRVLSHAALTAAVLLAAPGATARAADSRSNFESLFYLGLGVDSFAAQELRLYLNPEASGQKQERGVGGFDFAYRVWGKSADARQVWLYGETVHGVRSADLDLSSEDSLASFRLTGYANPGARTLYMVRNATSLEGFFGMKWEFLKINDKKDDENTATVYLMSEYGFLSVAGLGNDIVDESRYGLGVACVSGNLKDSHLEVGTGRTDLFAAHHWWRFKVDAMLNWTTEAMRQKGFSMFSQLTLDSDVGPGSDSIQSYLGFSLNLANFLPLSK